MRKIFDTMQLATECIIVSLIYLEKIMTTSSIEIRFSNWRPLLFTSILLSSKFWEDISFWNIDYAEALNFYPLKSINRMESEYVSLCDFHLYVSAELYANYYNNVRAQFKAMKQTGGGPLNANNPDLTLKQVYQQRIKGNTNNLITSDPNNQNQEF
jgi:hypothetical protein